MITISYFAHDAIREKVNGTGVFCLICSCVHSSARIVSIVKMTMNVNWGIINEKIMYENHFMRIHYCSIAHRNTFENFHYPLKKNKQTKIMQIGVGKRKTEKKTVPPQLQQQQ